MTSAESPTQLLVGIGNPGQEYADTRHNAGVWLVRRFAEQVGATFKAEKKFFGQLATARLDGREFRLLLPDTYMNESGKSVGSVAHFYKIAPEAILIAHDEIDFPSGKVRFKLGPEAVLKKLIHAVESPRPKLTYRVTWPTHFAAWGLRVLPSRLANRMIGAG